VAGGKLSAVTMHGGGGTVENMSCNGSPTFTSNWARRQDWHTRNGHGSVRPVTFLFDEPGITPARKLEVGASTDREADASHVFENDLELLGLGVLNALWCQEKLACC
jgi:hypothetical protein